MPTEPKRNRLIEKLKDRDFKLSALLEITVAINENPSTESLLLKYREIIENRLGIKRLVLFSKLGEEWFCILQYGIRKEISDIDFEEILLQYKEIEIIQSNLSDLFADFGILIPVFYKESPQAYLLIGDIDEGEIRMSPTVKHMNFIQTLTNLISVAIENKRLAEENIERERIKKELELAAQMQALLISAELPNNNKYEISSYYKPHHQVGGDYYDVIQLNEDEIVFCIADVSGKGISAAFLMSNFQAYMRALFQYTKWSLEGVINGLNEKVNDLMKGDRFITLFLAHYNSSTRELKYINAGHNPPVLLNNGETEELCEGTVGIGMFEKIPFMNSGSKILSENAVVTSFTDGLIEIENELGEEFGTERIGQCMKENSEKDMQSLIDEIVKSLEAFKGESPYFDDTALLCCKFL